MAMKRLMVGLLGLCLFWGCAWAERMENRDRDRVAAVRAATEARWEKKGALVKVQREELETRRSMGEVVSVPVVVRAAADFDPQRDLPNLKREARPPFVPERDLPWVSEPGLWPAMYGWDLSSESWRLNLDLEREREPISRKFVSDEAVAIGVLGSGPRWAMEVYDLATVRFYRCGIVGGNLTLTDYDLTDAAGRLLAARERGQARTKTD